MSFEYIIFQFPNIRLIVSELLKMGFTKESIQRTFKYWLKYFYYRSKRFYDSQYRRHSVILQSGFDRMTNQDCLEEHPKDFFARNGLYEHMNARKYAIQELIEQLNYIAPELRLKEQKFYSISEALLSAFTEFEDTLEIPISTFDELWFNSTVGNQKQIRDGLRKLNYSEYLKTWHWKKVRAAMLLLHNASCEHPECVSLGESWFGDEDSLHVHHLTYKNLGNEHFDELSLLCKTHHHLVHEEIRKAEREDFRQ